MIKSFNHKISKQITSPWSNICYLVTRYLVYKVYMISVIINIVF